MTTGGLLRCCCAPAGDFAYRSAAAAGRLLDGAPRRAAAQHCADARVAVDVLGRAAIFPIRLGLEDALRLAASAVVVVLARHRGQHQPRLADAGLAANQDDGPRRSSMHASRTARSLALSERRPTRAWAPAAAM